jgi:hypothetical protein
MFDQDLLEEAWEHTHLNAEEVKRSDQCACLSCEELVPALRAKMRVPSHVAPGLSPVSPDALSAACAHCNQATAIGDASGLPIQNQDFVRAAGEYMTRVKHAQN